MLIDYADEPRFEWQDVRRLGVGVANWVWVEPGPIDASIVEQLEKRGFDEAPVLANERQRETIGLVATSRLRELLDAEQPLLATDSSIRRDSGLHVGGSFSLRHVLKGLVDQRARLLVSEPVVPGAGLPTLGSYLVTVSDLNGKLVRSYLYVLLITVESLIAEVVREVIPEEDVWINLLNELHQIQLLGTRQYLSKQGMHLPSVATTTLGQLMQVCERSAQVQTAMGFRKKKEFEELTSGFVELRNSIMHPNRPLVTLQHGVETLENRLDRLHEFLRMIKFNQQARSLTASENSP